MSHHMRSRERFVSEILQDSGLFSEKILHRLREDESLGCGNMLDRILLLNVCKERAFLFLDRPLLSPGGGYTQALSLNTLQQYRMFLAQWYLQHGVKKGDVISVCVEDGITPFLHYLALTSLGATISLINPGIPADLGILYMNENGFLKLVIDAETSKKSSFVRQWQQSNETLDISTADFHRAISLPESWPFEPEDSTLVMLSHSSGTTGVPKAVRFEHRQFFMGKRVRIGRFSEGPDERLLTALPQSHSAAISHLETAILHGIPTYVVGSQDGEALRQAIHAFSPTTVAAFPHSYMTLIEAGIGDAEFTTVRRWLSMGDASHQSHIRRLLQGAPKSKYMDSFGSSELGMALFRNESRIDALAPHRSIGRPVDIAVAKILDFATGEEVPSGTPGLFAVRSPTITSGYWQQPEQTNRAWRNGYFVTGDIALCKKGVFYHVDREVDVVVTPSGNLYTLFLEEVAQQVDGVCDAVVVGVAGRTANDPEILVLILADREATRESAALSLQVTERIYESMMNSGPLLAKHAIASIVVDSLAFLPVGATGKILKRELRQSALSLIRINAERNLMN
ncbi:acyl--CoA ligase [Erwinia rhapontici]|uniref:class I adenylate-forming enzyme family protein n=1 Tax=Erwinia rhapontici TaxID=55212 RepID=UPI0014383106|nr:class I adenylate-forming enzyme family protein [Erwinia rhapontici]NKG29554.1 acyl--CoA ligase [Erwinia rhapontici]